MKRAAKLNWRAPVAPARSVAMPSKPTIIVYYDYVSPFAYIASEILPAIAERAGAELDWRPIDMLELSSFAGGLPYSPAKRSYVAVDALRTAEFHGVAIDLPKPFPVQSRLAVRLALVAQRRGGFEAVHRALFRAAWRDRQDLASEQVLAECVAAADGDTPAWLEEIGSPAIEQRVGELTAEAEAAGVFGVPTMVLDGELFWGVHSIEFLRWRLGGGDALRNQS